MRRTEVMRQNEEDNTNVDDKSAEEGIVGRHERGRHEL